MKHPFIGSKDWHASWPKISIDSKHLTVVFEEKYNADGEVWDFIPNEEDKQDLLLWMEAI